MAETINVELPRRGVGGELAEALAAHGFEADLVDEGETCALRVRYAADEHERLLGEVAHAIEGWLGDRMMPLVLERADGGCVLRPPAE
jgi:hypothetical protein